MLQDRSKTKQSVDQIFKLIQEVRDPDLWQEVFETKVGSSILAQTGSLLCQKSLQDHEVLNVIVSAAPSAFEPKYLPVLYPCLLDEATNQITLAKVLQKIMFYQQDIMFGDDLPNSVVNEIQSIAQEALYKCALKNVDSLIALLCQIN